MTFTDDKLQSQRFELKYIIEEPVALSVRDFLRSYLELDENGVGREENSYPIHSLYLDSPDLMLYQQTNIGEKNRFKLRLRYYDNSPRSPVFLEIKRRMNNTIAKQRGCICREAVPDLFAGHVPEQAQLVSSGPKHIVAVNDFCRLMQELQARPRTHVAYLREAWVSREDNSVRVTIDRQVRSEINLSGYLTTDMVSPVLVFGHHAVLELKFTGRFPDWFKELVEIFHLTQGSAAKYAEGVTLLGVEAVSRAFTVEVNGNGTVREPLPQVDRRAAATGNGSPLAPGLEAFFAK